MNQILLMLVGLPIVAALSVSTFPVSTFPVSAFPVSASVSIDSMAQVESRTSGSAGMLAEDRSAVTMPESRLNTRLYSFRYPENWIVDSLNTDNYLIMYQPSPPGLSEDEAFALEIKTDASVIPQPLSDFPSERGASRIVRIERLSIEGQPAVRVWTDEGENFPNAIVTYIRYDDRQTAFIASYYDAANGKAEPTILQVHNSFKVVSAAPETR